MSVTVLGSVPAMAEIVVKAREATSRPRYFAYIGAVPECN